jgi:CMP-N-acetylneuraminic acid synthetase
VIKNKKVLSIVPARGGSKGIKKKNITLCDGKPLIYYSIEAANNSKYIDTAIVNSDSQEILDTAKKYGASDLQLRPPHLAADNTPMIDVLIHSLDTSEKTYKDMFDIIVLLQPTSPLRTSKHIDEAIELFIEKEADSIVSIVQVPHNCSPASILKLHSDGTLRNYLETKENRILQRQKKPVLYARNGPAVLVLKRDLILKKSLYTNRTYPYLMNVEDSFDIDESFDLEIVDFLLKRRRRFNGNI